MSTVMVYKFSELSREVIEAMFTISELKQTRVYRDAMNEGRAEEALRLWYCGFCLVALVQCPLQ
jgi:predicted transposase YdaD